MAKHVERPCDKDKCTGCMACYNVCPCGAIDIKCEDGFSHPSINQAQCVACGKCEAVCPVNIKVQKSTPIDEVAYAVVNKDKAVRDSSSSGGVFYNLAEGIIRDGGTVYGAAWRDELSVAHIRITSMEEISRLQGSKYVQSDIGSIYREVKSDLEAGKQVLFSGVPCQIAGLKSYLQKEYDALYTCEVLCHGSASPIAFAEHIKCIGEKKNVNVVGANFRHKTEEKCQSMRYVFSDGADLVLENPIEDWYYNGFLSGVLLRESCFQCQYIGLERCADITLADFWGLQEEAMEFEDRMTYPSLVFVNTEKGKILFDANKEAWNVVERPMEEAVWGNLSLRRAIPKSKWKNRFWNSYKKVGYEKAAARCLVQHYSYKDIIKKLIGGKATAFLIKVLKR